MRNAIEHKVNGIKCDNPDCDYTNRKVTLKNFEKYLNKPCPKCGCILLTETDYRAIKKILKMTKLINIITKPFRIFSKPKKRIQFKIEMDGNGISNITKPKITKVI